MGSGDTFTYNDHYTMSEIEDYVSEYRSYIDQKRMENAHELHMILGDDGEVDRDLLRHRTVILVADGLVDGFTLRIAAEFLKTVAIKRLVVACPIASVIAVDKMHLYSDEICCLGVTENYLGADHYYDDNTIPDIEGVLKIMRNISMNWYRPLSNLKDPLPDKPATKQ
jgi:predicted phosphoribosyltransferase